MAGRRALRTLCVATDGLLGATALVLIVMFLGTIAAPDRVPAPTLFGRSVLTITSASMRPTLDVGDAILADITVDAHDIEPGDVVVYRSDVRPDLLITHRVIGASTRLDGSRSLVTAGDAVENGRSDVVTDDRLVGRLTTRLPNAGIALAAADNALVPALFTLAALLAHGARLISCSTDHHTNGIRRHPGASLSPHGDQT